MCHATQAVLGDWPSGQWVYSTLWLLPLLGTEYPGQEVEPGGVGMWLLGVGSCLGQLRGLNPKPEWLGRGKTGRGQRTGQG